MECQLSKWKVNIGQLIHSPHQTQLENILGEHIGNPLGTWREYARQEQRKNEKKILSPWKILAHWTYLFINK